MTEESGPLARKKFRDDVWRDLFSSDVPAIISDYDGTAYQLTMPPGTDTARVGSPVQDSLARVAGFLHRVPAGDPAEIEFPGADDTAVGRTDRLVVRYDSTITDLPGPCRLHRLPGVEGDGAPPEYDPERDLPLYRVTRRAGQSLNQAAVVDERRRAGAMIHLLPSAPLPVAPLGTRARRDGLHFVRELASSAPTWRSEALSGTLGYLPGYGPYGGAGWPAAVTWRIDPTTGVVHWSGMVRRTGGAFIWPKDTEMDILHAVPTQARPRVGPGLQPVEQQIETVRAMLAIRASDGRLCVRFRTQGSTTVPTGWWASLEGVSYLGALGGAA